MLLYPRYFQPAGIRSEVNCRDCLHLSPVAHRSRIVDHNIWGEDTPVWRLHIFPRKIAVVIALMRFPSSKKKSAPESPGALLIGNNR
jgi:hypothetical protein